MCTSSNMANSIFCHCINEKIEFVMETSEIDMDSTHSASSIHPWIDSGIKNAYIHILWLTSSKQHTKLRFTFVLLTYYIS